MNPQEQKIFEIVEPMLEEKLQDFGDKIDKKFVELSKSINNVDSKHASLTIPLDFKTKQAINTHVAYPVVVNLQNTDAATAANYDVFFTADYPCEVVSVSETHRVLGTDGGAVTLNIEKLTSGQALDAGTAIISTALSLKTTINTPQFGILVSTGARVLAKGDRLALVDSGTLTAVAGLTVTVYIKQI